MKAPFIMHRGNMYTQVDGVTMGSPLEVLFEDFCMGVVEERLSGQCREPKVYCRYINDTSLSVENTEELTGMIQTFSENLSTSKVVYFNHRGKPNDNLVRPGFLTGVEFNL